MAKVYRLKSVPNIIRVVEATAESSPLLEAWGEGKIARVGNTLEIDGINGPEVAVVGDWIAKGDDGFWIADVGRLITDYRSLGVIEVLEPTTVEP